MSRVSTASQQIVHLGIDVHLKTYAVTVLCDGVKQASISMPASPKKLIGYVKARYSGHVVHSVYEAGFSGFDLHRKLSAAGWTNIVVNPASIPTQARSRVKTDKIDSLKLATCLAKGLLTGIRIPTREEELCRELTRTRGQLVEDRKRASNRIKMKLYHHGIFAELPPMSEKFLSELLTLDLPFELKVTITCLVETWRHLSRQIRELDRHLSAQAEAAPELQRILTSVPGVGKISSRILANELGDMKQFPNERSLSSFVGLTPSEYSSGEKKAQGSITRQGSARIRHILVEISWRAIRRDGSLKELYCRLAARRGGKKAIVAVARHLICRIRACFLSGELYRVEPLKA